MNREKKTVGAMIKIYCLGIHKTQKGLCSECQQLKDYAWARLDRCPYQEKKPVCAKCPVHCYNPEMRGKVITVMRYAGLRMISKHPLLALLHTIRKPGTEA